MLRKAVKELERTVNKIQRSKIYRHTSDVMTDWGRRRDLARDTTIVKAYDPGRLRDTDLVVVCVVRDGGRHVEHFLRHHFRIGAHHVVLLDNGSTDSTAELASQFDRVTVLETNCPYKTHEYLRYARRAA